MTSLAPYPQYKPSGIDWLGDIPSHWSLRRIKHGFSERVEKGYPDEPLLAATQNHGVVTKDRYENRTVVAENGLELLKLVVPGDFVISLRSFQGGIELAHDRGIISPAYTVLKPEADTDPGYHKHLMKSFRFIELLQQHVTGIRQGQNIDYVKLGRAHIPLPPLNEQRSIADFLDRKDAEITRFIESRRRMIALLEEKKQAIINQAVTKGLDPSVPMKDSGVEWLGDIPAHWESPSLRYLGTKFGSGLTPRGGATTYQTEGVVFLRSQNIHFNGIRLTDVAYISEQTNNDMKNSSVQSDDVLINITGASIGRVTTVPTGFPKANVNQHVAIIRPRLNQVTPRFLALFLQSSPAQKEILQLSTGAAREGLAMDELKSLTIPLPSKAEQNAIVEYLNLVDQKLEQHKSRLSREIELMQEYRTRLVSDVVTGKVRV